MVQISPLINDSDHVAILRFVISRDSTFDSFESQVSETMISRNVSPLTMDGFDDFKLCKSDSPVHFQIFHFSSIYLDWTTVIFRHSDRTVEILSLHSDRRIDIFSLVLSSNS
jgi:hypothetical protein